MGFSTRGLLLRTQRNNQTVGNQTIRFSGGDFEKCTIVGNNFSKCVLLEISLFSQTDGLLALTLVDILEHLGNSDKRACSFDEIRKKAAACLEISHNLIAKNRENLECCRDNAVDLETRRKMTPSSQKSAFIHTRTTFGTVKKRMV